MRINEEIVNQFSDIIDNLKDIIDANGLKKGDVIEKSGMKRGTFYFKLKNKSFTVGEIKKIVNVINNEA